MKYDIDHLSESELIELNHRIVARLRMLAEMRAHQSMLKFQVGQRVQFDADGGRLVTGVLVKYNRKSVTLITDDGHRWNVSPSLLRRVIAGQADDGQYTEQNVLAFRKEDPSRR